MLLTVFTSFAMAAVIGVGGTPSVDLPDVIHRDKLPDGITVHEYNATEAAIGAATAPKLESRGLLEERGDCKGSSRCRRRVNSVICLNAVNRYISEDFYCGYTSRYSNHCTAIYRCDDDYFCLKGEYLQTMFRNIYTMQGCGRCGTYDFPVDCHATFNYCSDCEDIG